MSVRSDVVRIGIYDFVAVEFRSSAVYNDNSNLNIQEQDAYTMMDATIHKLWGDKRFKTTLGVRNILGVVNVNANTTNVGAHTPSTSFISISPGTTYFMTIRYELFK